MIKNIKLKSGRVVGSSSESIPCTPITVFVGPNNSGKSRVLAEIEQFCRTGNKNVNALVLEEITFSGLSETAALDAIKNLTTTANPGETLHPEHTFIGSKYGRNQVNTQNLKGWVQDPSSGINAFCQYFLTHSTLLLDGRSRINLVNNQGSGDLQQSPQSSFQVLFINDLKRKEVRRIVQEAFGTYFVIDPTALGNFRVRLSNREPETNMEERGIHAEAVEFHSKAQLIEEASDGVKAFTGILTELIAGDPRVLLIDEPEAFLHPSLASKLGYEISRAALSEDKRVFVSTHSPMFVMGCIQSGAPVNIIRLTYRGGAATSRILPSADILEMMRNPLLRSTGVLSALFYEFVVITESDADRAFYQEINERLLRLKPEWGIPNCLFINAQNKQTVQTILRPLRDLGIPAVGIVDIDILKDGGSTWANLLTSANIPDLSKGPLATMRAAVKTAMDVTGLDMKRAGGINILKGSDCEAAAGLLNQLAEYGIFVVPHGELESWLMSLGATGHGPTWLINIFEKMGEDSDVPEYIKPEDGDVWEFIGRIKQWLIDGNRKGIPA